MIRNKKLMLPALLICSFLRLNAQEYKFDCWYHNNSEVSIYTNEAYEHLKGMDSKKIIIAVIDSGVDINHEDLNHAIWVNKDEVPNNFVDDDDNGYKDDIHGWNFIGFSNGDNVEFENLIETRIAKAGDNYPGNKKMLQKARIEYLKGKDDAIKKRDYYKIVLKNLSRLKNLNSGNITLKALKGLVLSDTELIETKYLIIEELEKGKEIKTIENELSNKLSEFQKQIDFYYNKEFDSRQIVGDDFKNQTQKNYGNNDVIGPFANHGTHVAGIIAAKRGNGIGIDGIAENVEIMVLRVVPDGDERDKDVANAIIYAVDNGASIINMSFGKKLSWNKKIVDKAVKYAARKDVLIVHSAGNRSIELNADNSFPNPTYLFSSRMPKNWLEVGASTSELNKNLVADFSNYSSKFVDLFAPGLNIKSTIPNNKYDFYSGTSMATPMVTGVAAVLRSYFPNLKATEIKRIIIESVTQVNVDVIKPGALNKKELVPFSTLSKTGGILNFKNAVIKAKAYSDLNN